VLDDLVDVLALDSLVLEKGLGDYAQGIAVFLDDLLGPVELGLDDFADGLVDLLGGGLAEILGPVDFLAKKHMLLIFAVGDRAEIAHASVADHVAGGLYNNKWGMVWTSRIGR
jgi:hypothetical protein